MKFRLFLMGIGIGLVLTGIPLTAQVVSVQKTPEVVILDQLENIFEPVIFQHGLHADMATMDEGCAVCHHFSPDDRIPPCRECHSIEIEEHDLAKPTLNGAYHRQCLNCHKEWESKEVCETCHARKVEDGGNQKTPLVDKTDIIGVAHPEIHVPEKQIFKTKFKAGKLVTFHHREHIELYQFQCVDCHHQENCSTCHEGIRKIAPLQKKLNVHHDPCLGCHDTETESKCGFCHMKTESPGFSHNLTGWPLNTHHERLPCNACHPADRPLNPLETTCINCHTNWFNGNFDHEVTGLELSDTHVEFECGDCHLDEKFENPPDCASCHDDDVFYPDFLPGEKVE
ncbi:MAG: hypothetical protein AUJ47_07630 [Candidatus Marinimicrobia bacterium CG1_02_48_14]|nr:MAG: hypothetical protein AUJ47_07630 [Candidatus Marinimicrobia bacterium CG1_02_48_14]